MTWQDLINAGLEAFAGGAVLLHILALLRHRQLRGVSVPAVAFFTAWGGWNLYYYAHLTQHASAVAAIVVTLANLAYLALIWHFRRQPAAEDPRLAIGDRAVAMLERAADDWGEAMQVVRDWRSRR